MPLNPIDGTVILARGWPSANRGAAKVTVTGVTAPDPARGRARSQALVSWSWLFAV